MIPGSVFLVSAWASAPSPKAIVFSLCKCKEGTEAYYFKVFDKPPRLMPLAYPSLS